MKSLLPALALAAFLAAPADAAGYKIRMAIDEDPIVPWLAESLGYLKAEGVEIVRAKIEDFEPEDYLLQEPLNKGQIDAAYHWFNHAAFGARHNLPVKAVMVVNDAPGMTVLVAERLKDQVKGPADFKDRHVASGAAYGTKSVLTNYLAIKAGLPPHSYQSVAKETEGRQEVVLKGLQDGSVDVMTFQEPMTSALLKSGMVRPLLDFNSRQEEEKSLGAAFPAQSVLMAPSYIAAHPDAAQHLVNALVRTMRFINAHDADQIIAKLPAAYFAGKDRAAEIDEIKKSLPTFAKGDYAVSKASARLVLDMIQASDFDQSEEGKWRATAENPKVDADQFYDNRFVDKAMKLFR